MPTDDELQNQIDEAQCDLMRACTSQDRHAAWDRMRKLILQRSPERQMQMEVDKGLAEPE